MSSRKWWIVALVLIAVGMLLSIASLVLRAGASGAGSEQKFIDDCKQVYQSAQGLAYNAESARISCNCLMIQSLHQHRDEYNAVNLCHVKFGWTGKDYSGASTQ